MPKIDFYERFVKFICIFANKMIYTNGETAPLCLDVQTPAF